jgi:WD40-like Beta Propeller Repeat
MKTFRFNLVLMSLAVLVSSMACAPPTKPQDRSESLLSADNAYNPIPSPDRKYIAYVRTGWGRPDGSGGFGRSNLISEVIAIDQNGKPTTAKPLEDMFLEGWTPDSSQLVCFRDWKYAIVSTDGKRVEEGRIPHDADKHPATEWVAYSPWFAEIVWSRLTDKSHEAIETPTRTVERVQMLLGGRVVPSPDGRYLAVFGESPRPDLRVYDLVLKSWTDLGEITVHPDQDWWYIQPSWNPWFVDGSRLVFLRDSTLVIARPDGTIETQIKIDSPAGLPVPSPDGQSIAYVTFEPRPMRMRQDLQFWGGTRIWVVPAFAGEVARAVTSKNQDEVRDLKWLNNDALVFDRIADEPFYTHARIWKVAVSH